MKRWHKIVLGIILACHATGALACSISDIMVKQASWVRLGSQQQFLNVVGEIYNGCADAIGVHVQAVFRDNAGQVVTETEFWPASTRNIPAHTSFAFEHPANGDRPVAAIELHVIDVNSW